MKIKRFNNFGKVLTEKVNGVYACGGGGSGCGYINHSNGYGYTPYSTEQTESEKKEQKKEERRLLRKKKLAVVQKDGCEKCGTTLAKDSLFCHKCGTKKSNNE